MLIEKNIPLKDKNTFGIAVFARYGAEVTSVKNLQELIKESIYQKEAKLILGGGSNVLFTKDFEGIVIQNKIKGIEFLREDKEYVYLKVGSGEVWDRLVFYCVERGYAGIENLSLIPGSVGAAPMQNIGAYGVEVKDVIDEVFAFDLKTGEEVVFSNSDCEFGYRESIFKKKEKGKYIITGVTFRLDKHPMLKMAYGAISSELQKEGISEPSIKDIRDVVIKIRQSKLPDPAILGNAGSFFKNPLISKVQLGKIKKKFPSIPEYPQDKENTKVAAGWLIEQCGWKGRMVGHTGSHKDQALVLVNYGGATGKEIFDLSERIISSVKDKFGICLEREVNII